MPSVPPGGTLNFNVFLSNVQDAKSTNNPVITTSQYKQELRTPLLDAVRAQKQSLENSTSKSFFESYLVHIVATGAIAGYATLCYALVRGNYFLDKQTLWSSWRAELPFDQLLAIPQEQFGQELIREIQRKYSMDGTITDIILPFSKFLKDVEQEEETLQWYQELYSWLTFLHVTQVVPANSARYSKIPQRLQRIAYYKNSFKTWMSNYKMEQLAHSKKSVPLLENTNILKVASLIKKKELRTIEALVLKAGIKQLPEYA